MIIPEFDKSRIASPDAIKGAVDTLTSEMQRKDERTKVRVKENWDAAKKANQAAITAAEKTAARKKAATAKKRAATRAANKTKAVTTTTKTSVPGQSGAAKGRPNTKASTKTAGPGVNKMAKATINKTAARNVRKSTKVTPVTSVPKIKPVNGAGRRTNGAPKKRMR